MRKILLVLLTCVPTVLFATDYPDLFAVEAGKAFSHPGALQNKDTNRPTTQFRVPNYGSSATLFPEYEITYLNKNNKVAIVTAEKATSTWEQCRALKEEAAKLADRAFPDHKNTPKEHSQLKSGDEYSHEDRDIYYVLKCQGAYGPFAYLHFQMRSKTQDSELKAAWDEFFQSRNR